MGESDVLVQRNEPFAYVSLLPEEEPLPDHMLGCFGCWSGERNEKKAIVTYLSRSNPDDPYGIWWHVPCAYAWGLAFAQLLKKTGASLT